MGHGEGKGQTETSFEEGGNSHVREMLNEAKCKTVSDAVLFFLPFPTFEFKNQKLSIV